MKNILIISSSPRIGGNSDLLCDEFKRGAEENGNKVEKINLAHKKINFCIGCGACHTTGECIQKNDDTSEIINKMILADVIVLATPTYFYSMSGQLKTLIDRTCAKYTLINNKDFYFIITAADNNKSSLNSVVDGLRGFTACLNNANEKDIIYSTGVWQVGDVKNKKAMQEAYELGKTI